MPPPPAGRVRLNTPAGRGLTLAGTGRVDATPLRFFWNIFFVNCSIVTICSIAFRPSFLRPPENLKTLTPLTFHLWRHNWGHVRRKMRSVAHNLQTLPFFASDMDVDMWYQVVLIHSTGHLVLRRSTEVNRGQLRSNEVNDLCRLFSSSIAF